MEFYRSNVWMSLIDYQTFPTIEQIVEALDADGFECQFEAEGAADENWSSFCLLGPEDSKIQIQRFSVEQEVQAKDCLEVLLPEVERQPVCEERDQVLEMLQDAKFIVQSVKLRDSQSEAAGELEFGLHRCLGFPVDPDEGVSMWLLHNDGMVGFANEGDILLRMQSKSYNQWSE